MEEKILEYIYPKYTNNNHLLFEYYAMLSNPKDADILGNWQVWIYSNDRNEFTPHCHVRLSDGSIEFEVSLLTWEVINIKNSGANNSWDSIGRDVKKAFFEWLNRKPKQGESSTNKISLYTAWNLENHDNVLEKWVDKKSNVDEDLLEFLGLKINCIKLRKEVINQLVHIYFTDKSVRYELHKLQPQELLNALEIGVELKNNKDAVQAVIDGEK